MKIYCRKCKARSKIKVQVPTTGSKSGTVTSGFCCRHIYRHRRYTAWVGC